MVNPQLLLLVFAFCLAACQPLVDRLADDIADQVSEQVADEVNTAVAEQFSTAIAEITAADGETQSSAGAAPALDALAAGEVGQVTRVIDGDTIDVLIDGKNTRIRYLQMNTPERDQPCYRESTARNAELVAGKTVRLVPDTELVDPYDRLLRYVYVDDVSVSRVLVEEGYAEVVLYPPNDEHYEEFVALEQAAAAAGLGCHPTGIFDDGSTRR